MADRGNHYEAALEAWLQQRRIPYVAVDEARRAQWSGGSLKSLDFIVSPGRGRGFLIDVKGRRFPGAGGRYWKNWSFQDDVASLGQWERLFGPGFEAALVFAYWVAGPRSPVPPQRLFAHRGRRYAFLGVRLSSYRAAMRRISPCWDTVEVPAAAFRCLACELEQFLLPEVGTPPEGAALPAASVPAEAAAGAWGF